MRAAAARADVPAAAAIAAVTTTGYVGFMAGPPLVGLLAHASSLRLSLGVVGALCAGAALLARAVQDEPQPTPARRRAYAVTAAARPEKTSAQRSTAASSCVTESVHSSSRPGVMKMPRFIDHSQASSESSGSCARLKDG